MAKWKRGTQISVSQAKEPHEIEVLCFGHLLTQVTASCQDDGEGDMPLHIVREMAVTASGVALWRLAVDRRGPTEAEMDLMLPQAVAQDQ
jgi:hypothetical protein